MESFEVGATLLATYSLSGCDTVSYPYNRGKRRAAKVALDLVGHLPNLAQFGHESNVLDDHINEARVFWTHLYGRPGFASLDLLRQHLFSSSKSDLRLLPVTEDAFNLHVLRALYQLMIFKRAHLCNLALPPATEFGRNIVNGRLVLILMTKKAKPGIGKTVSCKCKSLKCVFQRGAHVRGQMYHVVPHALALDFKASVVGLAWTLLRMMMIMIMMMHRIFYVILC